MSSTWPLSEASVPPLKPPFIAVTTSVVSPSSPAPSARTASCEQQRAEVGGDRVEAARVDDPHARLGGAVVALHALAHEQHLAGQVEVVGARLDAGVDQRQPVAPVRADRRRHHARAARHRGERGRVGGVRHHERPVGRARAELRAHVREPLLGAPGEPDPGLGGRVVGEVLRDQPPDEAGRAEDDDVEGAATRAQASRAGRGRGPRRRRRRGRDAGAGEGSRGRARPGRPGARGARGCRRW